MLYSRCSDMNNWWRIYGYEVKEVPEIHADVCLFAYDYMPDFITSFNPGHTDTFQPWLWDLSQDASLECLHT